MNLYLAALLDKPSMLPDHCVIPGCTAPANNAHHVIPGRRKDPRNPRLRLCGSGTTGHHGEAHMRRLHFRWRDGWQYLLTDEPTKYDAALEMTSWMPLD